MNNPHHEESFLQSFPRVFLEQTLSFHTWSLSDVTHYHRHLLCDLFEVLDRNQQDMKIIVLGCKAIDSIFDQALLYPIYHVFEDQFDTVEDHRILISLFFLHYKTNISTIISSTILSLCFTGRRCWMYEREFNRKDPNLFQTFISICRIERLQPRYIQFHDMGFSQKFIGSQTLVDNGLNNYWDFTRLPLPDRMITEYDHIKDFLRFDKQKTKKKGFSFLDVELITDRNKPHLNVNVFFVQTRWDYFARKDMKLIFRDLFDQDLNPDDPFSPLAYCIPLFIDFNQFEVANLSNYNPSEALTNFLSSPNTKSLLELDHANSYCHIDGFYLTKEENFSSIINLSITIDNVNQRTLKSFVTFLSSSECRIKYLNIRTRAVPFLLKEISNESCKIEGLDITSIDDEQNDEISIAVDELFRESIHLVYFSIGCLKSNNFAKLQEIKINPNSKLRYLDFGRNELGDSTVYKLIQELKSNPTVNIQCLYLGKIVSHESLEIVSNFLTLPQNKLVFLQMDVNQEVDDSDIQLLADCLSSPNCKLLNLRIYGLETNGIINIALACQKDQARLRVLHLGETSNIDDQSEELWVELGKAVKYGSLTSLAPLSSLDIEVTSVIGLFENRILLNLNILDAPVQNLRIHVGLTMIGEYFLPNELLQRIVFSIPFVVDDSGEI